MMNSSCKNPKTRRGGEKEKGKKNISLFLYFVPFRPPAAMEQPSETSYNEIHARFPSHQWSLGRHLAGGDRLPAVHAAAAGNRTLRDGGETRDLAGLPLSCGRRHRRADAVRLGGRDPGSRLAKHAA